MKAASLLLISFLVLNGPIRGQALAQTGHPGIVLFKQGKFSEAIRSLEGATKTKEFKSNAEIWNYLGLAYFELNEIKNSRKALEKSVALNPINSAVRGNLAYTYLFNRQINKALKSADKAIELDPKNSGAYHVRGVVNLWESKLDSAERDADMLIHLAPTNPASYMLKSEVLISRLGTRLAAGSTIRDELGLLRQVVEILETGVSKAKESADLPKLRRELESMSAFYTHFSRYRTIAPALAPQPPEAGVTPYRILEKPRASYTDRARTAGITGSVILVVLLGASGKVEHVLLLKRLGYGLDEQAIMAAKKIKFEPKLKDGKPVPAVVTFDYGFSIY